MFVSPQVLSAPIFHVFTLHSSVPTEEQNAVFDPLPEGHRKIILATNIAETSITINDVVFVVDCGRVKEVKSSWFVQYAVFDCHSYRRCCIRRFGFAVVL